MVVYSLPYLCSWVLSQSELRIINGVSELTGLQMSANRVSSSISSGELWLPKLHVLSNILDIVYKKKSSNRNNFVTFHRKMCEKVNHHPETSSMFYSSARVGDGGCMHGQSGA